MQSIENLAAKMGVRGMGRTLCEAYSVRRFSFGDGYISFLFGEGIKEIVVQGKKSGRIDLTCMAVGNNLEAHRLETVRDVLPSEVPAKFREIAEIIGIARG